MHAFYHNGLCLVYTQLQMTKLTVCRLESKMVQQVTHGVLDWGMADNQSVESLTCTRHWKICWYHVCYVGLISATASKLGHLIGCIVDIEVRLQCYGNAHSLQCHTTTFRSLPLIACSSLRIGLLFPSLATNDPLPCSELGQTSLTLLNEPHEHHL